VQMDTSIWQLADSNGTVFAELACPVIGRRNQGVAR
jgi:hypothetical protein